MLIRFRRVRDLWLFHLLLVALACLPGCYANRAIEDMGKMYASVSEPSLILVGDDQSVSMFTETTYTMPSGTRHVGQRIVYFSPDFLGRTIRQMAQYSHDRTDDGEVIVWLALRAHFNSTGVVRMLPADPQAPDATFDLLPAASRAGTQYRWPDEAIPGRIRSADVLLFPYTLDGQRYMISPKLYAHPSQRRTGLGGVAHAILLVPAIVFDVVTFPVQLVIGLRELDKAT